MILDATSRQAPCCHGEGDAPARAAEAKSPPLAFARAELRRYLGRMVPAGDEWAGNIELCLARDTTRTRLPAVPDAERDDAYEIQVHDGRGFIAGTNGRSVLFGVYRFLQESGCRWVRPGTAGEMVPQLSAAEYSRCRVALCEVAVNRHRGVCIEGAPSREHVLDLIDWLPRVGLNSYFIQFREAYAFYERWYRHLGNPTLAPEPFDLELARRFKAEAVDAVKQRGLLYHAVGHGWTCEAVGVPSLSWIPADHAIRPENRELLAEIKGTRDFFNRISLNTNLCYGHPEARRKIVAEIVRYAAAHPEVDYLHFWLADDMNNQCECPRCAGTRPADFYVMMLNDLDRELAARHLATRIVLLCYLDLLWPPERERIQNPSRFALMFAPITRTWSKPFPAKADAPTRELPAYQRNALVMPRDVRENLAFLQAWRRLFPELDTFDFDYHLMWAHFKDPGHGQIAQVLHEDAGCLQVHGLNGFMSCQVQRLFAPSSLPMTVLGRSLWNPAEPLERIAREALSAEFGPDWESAAKLLHELTRRFDPERLNGDAQRSAESAAALLESVPVLVNEHMETVRRNRKLGQPVQADSWGHLERYLTICTELARALAAKARGDKNTAHELWRSTLAKARAAELELAAGLDLFHFTVTWSHHQFDHVEDPVPPATSVEGQGNVEARGAHE